MVVTPLRDAAAADSRRNSKLNLLRVRSTFTAC